MDKAFSIITMVFSIITMVERIFKYSPRGLRITFLEEYYYPKKVYYFPKTCPHCIHFPNEFAYRTLND